MHIAYMTICTQYTMHSHVVFRYFFSIFHFPNCIFIFFFRIFVHSINSTKVPIITDTCFQHFLNWHKLMYSTLVHSQQHTFNHNKYKWLSIAPFKYVDRRSVRSHNLYLLNRFHIMHGITIWMWKNGDLCIWKNSTTPNILQTNHRIHFNYYYYILWTLRSSWIVHK